MSSLVRDSSYHDMYYKGCGLLCAHKKSFNTAIPVRSLGPYMYVHYCTCIVHILVWTYLFLLTSFFDCLSFCGSFLKHPYKRFFPFYILYFYLSRFLSFSYPPCLSIFVSLSFSLLSPLSLFLFLPDCHSFDVSLSPLSLSIIFSLSPNPVSLYLSFSQSLYLSLFSHLYLSSSLSQTVILSMFLSLSIIFSFSLSLSFSPRLSFFRCFSLSFYYFLSFSQSLSQSCLSLSIIFSFSPNPVSFSLSLSLLFPTLSLFQSCSISLQHCLSPTHISFSLFHQAYLSLRHSHKERERESSLSHPCLQRLLLRPCLF